MIGVFVSLDFFPLRVLGVGVAPMYFIIGVWGGPRSSTPPSNSSMYTLAGSVLMLLGILTPYSQYHQQFGAALQIAD
jgi:NADH-quinone oxidoreductase subunit M